MRKQISYLSIAQVKARGWKAQNGQQAELWNLHLEIRATLSNLGVFILLSGIGEKRDRRGKERGGERWCVYLCKNGVGVS
jgi:hypothetical protein